MKRSLGTFAVAALLLAGCTAVPSHSAPETIQPIQLNAPSESPPPPGASPREIVQDFLNISAAEAGAQNSSREYLTPAARSAWQDSSATVVDSLSIGTYRPPRTTITVTGRVIGTVTDSGIYKPSLLGAGSGGGNPYPYEFHIKKVHGQYRIDRLPDGLLLTADEFANTYTAHTLEFPDLSGTYLVPDLRYTPIPNTDQQQKEQLANWLVDQLAAGPREPELSGAVISSGLPNPATRNQLSVQLGSVTKIEVAGSAQLNGLGRDRLAAELSRTLLDVVGNGSLSITDGGKAIQIPEVHSNQFVATQFENAVGPPLPPPLVYYLRDGRVVDGRGQDLTGDGVDGTPYLSSVALADPADDLDKLSVAGTVGSSPSARRLYVGTQQLGLRATSVTGPLSRPAWAPNRPEVWIGDGKVLYRLTVSAVTEVPHRVDLPSADNDQPIEAVRISPDGSRLALVLGNSRLGSGGLYEGAIVRTAGQVRVQDLFLISPQQVVITDVAWIDPTKLLATGYLKGSGDARLCETNVDGSGWVLSGVPGLPEGPVNLTATAHELAWVEADHAVWEQGSSLWVSPGPTGQTPGYAPVYLE